MKNSLKSILTAATLLLLSGSVWAADYPTVMIAGASEKIEPNSDGSFTLPTLPCSVAGYSFAGWSKTYLFTETKKADVIPAGKFETTEDVLLYPVYLRGNDKWVKTSFDDVTTGKYILLTSKNEPVIELGSRAMVADTENPLVFNADNYATYAPEDVVVFDIVSWGNSFQIYVPGGKELTITEPAVEGEDYVNFVVKDDAREAWHRSEEFGFLEGNNGYIINNPSGYIMAARRGYIEIMVELGYNLSDYNISLATYPGDYGYISYLGSVTTLTLAQAQASGTTYEGKPVKVTLDNAMFGTIPGTQWGVLGQETKTESFSLMVVDYKGFPELMQTGRWYNGSLTGVMRYASAVGMPVLEVLSYDDATIMSTSVTVSDMEYATYCFSYDVEVPAGVEVYIANVEGKVITLEKLDTESASYLPAGQGFLLKAAAGNYTFVRRDIDLESVLTPTEVVDAFAYIKANNDFKGVTKAVSYEMARNLNPNYYVYVLGNGSKGLGFYHMDPYTDLPAPKAYLLIEVSAFASGAEAIELRFGGTTMVESMLQEDSNVEIYDLLGRRVEKAEKGIYIVNGKKMLVK